MPDKLIEGKRITCIHTKLDSAGLGILVKTGREYAYIAPVFLNSDDGTYYSWDKPNKDALADIVIIEGFHPEVIAQYRAFQMAGQDWRNARDTTYHRVQYEQRSAADAEASRQIQEWEKTHPAPKRDDFITPCPLTRDRKEVPDA